MEKQDDESQVSYCEYGRPAQGNLYGSGVVIVLPSFTPDQTLSENKYLDFVRSEKLEAKQQLDYWDKKYRYCCEEEKKILLEDNLHQSLAAAQTQLLPVEQSEFLKPPYNDSIIIDAMQDASLQVLGESHQQHALHITWKDCHVMICLVYYINLGNFGIAENINNMLKFHSYCCQHGNFPTLLTRRQCHDINQNLLNVDFGKCLADAKYCRYEAKVGKATMGEWVKFYQGVTDIFAKYIY